MYSAGVAVAVRWVGKAGSVLAEDFLVLVVDVESRLGVSRTLSRRPAALAQVRGHLEL